MGFGGSFAARKSSISSRCKGDEIGHWGLRRYLNVDSYAKAKRGGPTLSTFVVGYRPMTGSLPTLGTL